MAYSTEFYLRREQQERAIARCAINPEIAAIHNAMAERYAELAETPASKLHGQGALASHASFPGRPAV